MAVLGSIFQSEENNYILEEALEEYELDFAEEAYKDPGEHATMVFMASGGGSQDGNASHWEDKKHT